MSYSVPTAEFAVDLRVPIAGHDNEWEWRRCQEQPLSLEFIYSHSELCRAVQIYAPVAAKTIPAGRYEGFRIVVHGAITGRLLATYEWR